MDYLTIPLDFTRLDLSASELNILSLVYSYSRAEAGIFYGTMLYASVWACCTERTARSIFRKLEAEGYIKRQPVMLGDGAIRTGYYTTEKISEPEKFSALPEKISADLPEKFSGNNKDNNNITPLITKVIPPTTKLPYSGADFLRTWDELVATPKWKKKTRTALQRCADFLGKHSEADAVKIMEKSIMNDWQGLFELDAKDRQGRRTNERGESPTVASYRAAQQSFQRIADRYNTRLEIEEQNNDLDK